MHINDLPPEMLVRIFSYLPVESLLHVLSVCKRWQAINHCLHSWKHHPLVYDNNRTKYEDFIELVEEHSSKIGNILFRGVDYDKIHKVLNLLPILTRFEMIMCAANVQMPQDLLKYPDLRSLQVRNCYMFGSRSNMQPYDFDFHKLQKLEAIWLSDFGLSNLNFEGLISCRKLGYVVIEKIRNISQDNIVRLVVERKEQLHTLGIFSYGYTDEVTKHISACSKLTKLRLIRCDHLTDKSLTFLQGLNLTTLILWNNSNFTEEALIALFERGKLHNLTVLSFSKITNLTMETLVVVAKTCLRLESVAIYRCPSLKTPDQTPAIESLFSNAEVFC